MQKRPSNIRHKPSPLDPDIWRDRASRTKTWIVNKTPEPVREVLPEAARVRRAMRIGVWSVVALYAALVAFSLGSAYLRERGAHDRRIEVERAEQQLAEARAQTEVLRSRREALRRREEVRIDAIRREVNLLKQGEQVYVVR
ncbi:MAG: hypothetical protein RIT45_4010 [Pseudomonadota bacterium]